MIYNERIRRPISDGELARRWALTRKLLADKDLDCLMTMPGRRNVVKHFGVLVVPAVWCVVCFAFPQNEQLRISLESPPP